MAQSGIEDRIKAEYIQFKGYAVCLNDDDDRGGTRIGPPTQNRNEAVYAARVVRSLLKDLRSAPLRNHIARFDIQREIGSLGCHTCRADEIRAGTGREAWNTVLEREGVKTHG